MLAPEVQKLEYSMPQTVEQHHLLFVKIQVSQFPLSLTLSLFSRECTAVSSRMIPSQVSVSKL